MKYKEEMDADEYAEKCHERVRGSADKASKGFEELVEKIKKNY